MTRKLWILLACSLLFVALAVIVPCLKGGEMAAATSYQVLAPIRHGNLTIFPVVTADSHDTRGFLTLDEGLRSGEVIVTEAGSVSPLVRPRHSHAVWQESRRNDGAEANRLVLVNNSKKPLLLLAGEIVTGGKQDRIIGKDRLIPAESDPVDLSVFCVEPGRWVATAGKASFISPPMVGGPIGGGIVQPSVRSKAMADKDQQKVWAEVGNSKLAMARGLPAAASQQVEVTSSYAGVI